MQELKSQRKSGGDDSGLEATVGLLKELIRIPSLSGQEGAAAALIYDYLKSSGVSPHRSKNNVWAFNNHYDAGKPTILLNSHIDTVRPAAGYSRDPFSPVVENGRLFGLGSNDAGASLVCLLHVFLHYYEMENLEYNLVFTGVAEEEISGKNGVSHVLPLLGSIDCGIVGEPTGMKMTLAQKGLMVLDCVSRGKAGHAARKDGVNAIYEAMKDISWFSTYNFENESRLLGPVIMNVTMIQSGTQHNVIPDECRFVVDIRTTDTWPNEKALNLIREHVKAEVNTRGMRLNANSIRDDHPLIKAGLKIGLKTFGSPTMSDTALMSFPALKMGPGDTVRSHGPDEFILIEELDEALKIYKQLLDQLLLS